jgi:hypothetical protein
MLAISDALRLHKPTIIENRFDTITRSLSVHVFATSLSLCGERFVPELGGRKTELGTRKMELGARIEKYVPL